MHTEAHLFSVPNDCLWYDKLWGPSQRVVTLFLSDNCQLYLLEVSVHSMAGSGKIICVKKKSSDLSQRSFQMFFLAYLFPALLFLTPSPAEGIVGGVKAQIGQFPYIVSVNSGVYVTTTIISIVLRSASFMVKGTLVVGLS